MYIAFSEPEISPENRYDIAQNRWPKKEMN